MDDVFQSEVLQVTSHLLDNRSTSGGIQLVAVQVRDKQALPTASLGGAKEIKRAKEVAVGPIVLAFADVRVSICPTASKTPATELEMTAAACKREAT